MANTKNNNTGNEMNEGQTVEAEVVIDAEVEMEEVVVEMVDDMVEADEIIEVHAVADLKDRFTTLQDDAYEVSQKLAEDISMLELDETKEMIQQAIAELESFAGANEAVSIGFFGKIGNGLLALPGVGAIAGAVGAIKDEADKQAIASGNIKDAAERLFATLENKQKTLEKTTYSVMEISQRRNADLVTLEEMEAELIAILENPETDPKENFQARNMIIQVKEALIQSTSKIDQVEIIIESAQSSTFAITSLLPKIKNNFLDDLTISAGLNHLLQYKSMFDETLALVNNIEEHNFAKINQAMIDVVDLNITTSETDRLTRMSNDRLKAHDQLIDKTKDQIQKQTKSIAELTVVQGKMQQLGNRQSAALLASQSGTPAKKTTKKAAGSKSE